MSDFKEIEFKYYASKIPRESFDSVVREIGSVRKELLLYANAENGKDSVDHYFTNPDGPRFMRWREGQDKNGTKTWELTSKLKLNNLNNNVRDEVNITLNARDMNLEKAKEFSAHHNCQPDFSIKKDVQIYWIDKIVLSHYTVFSPEDKMLDVFMEIEADETCDWESEEEAMDAIILWEKKLAPLGITAQNRIKKSLFEFFTNFKG